MRFGLVTLVLVACTSCSATQDASSPVDAGVLDGFEPNTDRFLAGPLVPPELYDCRSPNLPSRPARSAALNCAFDPACTKRLVVGHRSAGGTSPGLGVLAPENTMSAVRAAIYLGADFIETDPRSTKDGVIVNVHDNDLKGTTTSTALVEQMNWSDIKELDLKYPDTVRGDFSCDRVISIRELLVAAKGRINVLLDANKLREEDIATLIRVIRETDTFDEAVFDTSSIPKVIMARAIEPQLKVHIRPDRPALIESEIEQVGAPPPVVIELDLKDLAESIAIVQAKWPDTRIMIDSLGPLDFQSAVAGEASPDMVALYDMGVDMIQTDRIDLLLEAVGRLSGAP
jgi:glycerophosphoryl diester phosphodiesterase